jgi:hypothetical protein
VPSVLEAGLGWSMLSTRRERPRMSERRMNSCFMLILGDFREVVGVSTAYLADVGTDLAHGCQELDGCHPFVVAKSGFSCVVMQVLD